MVCGVHFLYAIAQAAMQGDLIPAQTCHLLCRCKPTYVCLSSCLLLSNTWTGAPLLYLTQCACYSSLCVCPCKPCSVITAPALRYNIMCHSITPVGRLQAVTSEPQLPQMREQYILVDVIMMHVIATLSGVLMSELRHI